MTLAFGPPGCYLQVKAGLALVADELVFRTVLPSTFAAATSLPTKKEGKGHMKTISVRKTNNDRKCGKKRK
jgi:hypothetical protein